jgi:S-DNA-T family DNA segregation ATPase FtsK/SpoIIIE
MRGRVEGEQYAQVDNTDPFASPIWRSPVYRTPEWVIWLVQLLRLLARVLWFVVCHPLLDVAAGVLLGAWHLAGWPGLVAVLVSAAGVLAVVRVVWPASFTRWVVVPARNRWRRWWWYRRRWHAVMTITKLAPLYRGRPTVPVLGKVRAGAAVDLVAVRMVSGQSPQAFADRAEALAHGFGVLSCRVRTGRPGTVVLELVRRDALAAVIPALPVPAFPDLRALPVGRREDGAPFTIRLHGTHLLVAGSTGAGKGSYLWGLVRAMLPAMAAGLVRVHACDPKLMELAFGKPLFEAFGKYAADPAGIAELLEADVADMQQRAARFAGMHRDHQPTTGFPFVVVLVDEVAFLTAYQADRKLRDRTLAALATLTTQGRAAGYAVVAALQDPRKEVLNIRNLFPDKIALRLDEPAQVDLVLGEGAHDRGARCEDISSHQATGAGVGFVRLETNPDPVRVRAAFVSDADIQAMAVTYTTTTTAPGEAA